MVSASAPGHTRRGIALLAVGTGAATLAGCSTKPKPSHVPLSTRTPGAGTDVELLAKLLRLERYAIAAYAAGLPLLDTIGAAAAKQFLNQELSHAAELEGLIRQAGGEPPEPPAFYDLGSPRVGREALVLLHRVEQAQLIAYLAAIPRSGPSRLRAALAAIVANEAQHAAVVRERLGLTPVPAALVGDAE